MVFLLRLKMNRNALLKHINKLPVNVTLQEIPIRNSTVPIKLKLKT